MIKKMTAGMLEASPAAAYEKQEARSVGALCKERKSHQASGRDA